MGWRDATINWEEKLQMGKAFLITQDTLAYGLAYIETGVCNHNEWLNARKPR